MSFFSNFAIDKELTIPFPVLYTPCNCIILQHIRNTGCGLVMKEDITQRTCWSMKSAASCGLVMKEDITQLEPRREELGSSCGLVMKEDITQLLQNSMPSATSCGLVMKEDITQLYTINKKPIKVVVW